ncbi:MAG: glycosyltransferase family 39 protein [Lentimicrobium sp.]|uniref:ArnT family glycosyltransferase n=1 Tax=Lentimicrobium sp. TaxID=2034841 RepID=UPI0025DAB166|nr:glycosyltransferase family 39 protein [Lentimicrobium sp.]MCO5256624.1 glycosyltransferase family 39 protein [Lentimicrobium sp.]
MIKPAVSVKIALIAVALLYLYSLWHREPDVDDAWIGEHAYWLVEKGYVKSELMHGITNQHVRNIVHHKLFTLNGALFIVLFGFSLWTLKSVSLMWLMIFSIIFFITIRRKEGSPAAWFAMLLMAVNAFIFQYSFVYRPEIMVMTLGFISWLFLDQYLQNKKIYTLIFSGIFAGLAASAHLNGLIFIMAGGLLLLWNRKLLPAIIFGLSVLPSLMIYFFDFTREYGFSYWLYQLNDAPALHKSSILPHSLSFFGKIFREHMRFFHSPAEISQSLLLLFCLILGYPFLKQKKALLRYFLLLVISLSLVAVHTTSKYMLMYMPFILYIITITFVHIYNGRKTEQKLLRGIQVKKAWPWAVALLFIYFSIGMIRNIQISTRKFDPGKHAELSNKYIDARQDTVRVIAPMDFIFNEIEHFGRIQGDLSFADMQKAGHDLHGKSFLKMADSLGIHYLLLSDHYLEKFGLDGFTVADFRSAGFTIAGKEENLQIIKNEEP